MNKRYFIFVGILVAIFFVLNLSTPEKVNWEKTFVKSDKNPFGAEVTYAFLEDIYGTGNVNYTRSSPYESLKNISEPVNYIMISPSINIEDLSGEKILESAENGSTIFISTEMLSGVIADTFNLNIAPYFINENFKDTTSLIFTNQSLPFISYKFKHDEIGSLIIIDSTKETSVVLKTNEYNIIMTKFKWGLGTIYIHSSPATLMNVNMLKNNNQQEYISTVLSHLPKRKTYWSEYYSKGGSQDKQTELRYLIDTIQLRWALFIVIIGIFVYLVFQSKRRQKMIPIIKPPQNSTLEFVETTGRLYFQQKDHTNLARKKIAYFLEKVRTHYYISTSNLNEDFISQLVGKSAVDEKTIIGIVTHANEILKTNNYSEQKLIELNNLIDNFYKKAGI